MKNIIIGLGTGRCGTVSLTNLFKSQSSCVAEHEYTAHNSQHGEVWGDNFMELVDYIESKSEKFVCEISFYNLPYIDQLIDRYDDVKFIIMKRDRQETINSYLKKTINRNHWQEHDGTRYKYCKWDSAYPKFEGADKADSIGMYWDYYYETCSNINQALCYNLNLDDLNNEGKCLDMLSFCGFVSPKYLNIKLNQTK